KLTNEHINTHAQHAALPIYVSLPLALGIQAEVVLAPDYLAEPLSAGRLTALRDAATPCRVDLHLPRARLEAGTRLAGPLATLGVCRIFDVAAPAVTGVADQPLFISYAVFCLKKKTRVKGGCHGIAMSTTASRTLSRSSVCV